MIAPTSLQRAPGVQTSGRFVTAPDGGDDEAAAQAPPGAQNSWHQISSPRR